MTTNEPMTPRERALRDRLHAQLVPPSTPDRLHLAVDTIAVDAIDAPRPRRRLLEQAPSLDRRMGITSRLRVGLAMAAAMVLVAGVLATGIGLRGTATVAGTPFPSLPSGASDPLPLIDGAWVSADVAWVEDEANHLYMTEDGGMTWSEPRWLPPVDGLRDLGFRDASNGWAVHTPITTPPNATSVPVEVYQTRDGGRTWVGTSVGSLPSASGHEHRASLHFSDASHGVVLAVDTARDESSGTTQFTQAACAGWTTADAGVTWQELASAPCSSAEFWASPAIGVALGGLDATFDVSLTLDGGRSWTKGVLPSGLASPTAGFLLFALSRDGTPQLVLLPIPSGEVLLSATHPTVVETHDGGRTWTVAYSATAPGIATAAARAVFEPDSWLVAGTRTTGQQSPGMPILESRDGGRSWVESGTMPNGIYWSTWLDRLHAMAMGTNSGAATRFVLITNDGGTTWHTLPVEDPRFAPRSSPSASTSSPAAISAAPSAVDIESLASDMQAYGSTVADEFGGGFIDQAGNNVVALFTGNLELHRQAILDRVGKPAPQLVVRQVKYSEAELNALQDRINADTGPGQPDWLTAINAKLMGVGVDVEHNCVGMEISTSNPEVPTAILARFGVPADELRIESDGTGVQLMPKGWVDVSVQVAARVAGPPGGWSIDMHPDAPGIWGGGDIGYGVEAGGKSAVPATVGGWTVNLLDENQKVMASGHVTILADKHVPLVISIK